MELGLTKGQALKALKEGYKVTHRYFTPEEYIYMKDGDIFTEEGYNAGDEYCEFWTSKNTVEWQTGWEIYKDEILPVTSAVPGLSYPITANKGMMEELQRFNRPKGQPRVVPPKIGRNKQCLCGSGKKNKNCCKN